MGCDKHVRVGGDRAAANQARALVDCGVHEERILTLAGRECSAVG